MVDLHPILADMLSDVARVELSFPDAKADLPLITLTELSSSSDLILDGEERLQGTDWQIDVWDSGDTPEHCEQIAFKVDKIMIAAGFTRYFGQQLRDPAIPQRKCLRYRGQLDTKTYYMYRS